MSVYGQGYAGGPGGSQHHHPPPGAPYGGGVPPGGPSAPPHGGGGGPYAAAGGQYGGAAAPAGYAPYGGGGRGQYGGGAAPGGPYGGYGGGQYGPGPGGAPGGPYGGGQAPGGPYGGGYGGQPTQGGQYGQQTPAGALPPGVNAEAYQWFQTVDTDRSGSISLKELKQALVNSNWSAFNDETCLMMLNMFDKTRTGRMDLFGFSALWLFLQQWRALFQQYDRDRSGAISGTELHQALSQMGYNLSPQFTESLAGRFSAAGGGGGGRGGGGGGGRRPGSSVQLDGFIQVCTQLQTMTDAFRQKDAAMTGTVRMNYEDFLACAVDRLM